ncbi:MAG: Verru_Chthon cassette protein B [Chthoniobacterales bacterium]
MKKRFTFAFSLVEVTLAIGIAAFCLIALFGLMPIAVQTNRNATSQAAATNLISSVIADMRATTSPTSPQYAITFGITKTLYFDGAGQFATSLGANSRYRASVTFPSSPAGLSYSDINLTWPAAATPANASGSVEMFAAFDKN